MKTLLRPGVLVLAAVIAFCSGAQCAPEPDDQFTLGYLFATYGYSKSQRFSRAAGLFYDTKRRELYVADSGNGQIVILDNKGVPSARISHSVDDYTSGQRKTRLGEPKSIVVLKNGDILVTDNLCDYLDILDFRGRSVQRVYPRDLLTLPKTAKVMPRQLAIDSSENVYVSVSGDANEILVLSPDLKLKTEIAKVENKEAGLQSLTGLWVDKDGWIYANYAQGDGVRVYAPDGRGLASFGKHDSGPQNFSLPSGLVTDAKGHIWVLDSLRHVVSVFRRTDDGSAPKWEWMETGKSTIGGYGNQPGDLAFPTAIAGDGVDKVFVLEGTGARVQGFEIHFKDTAAQPK